MKEKQLNYFRKLKLPAFRKKPKKVSENTLIEQERKFVLTENKSFYSREAYNTLRTNILFSLADVEGCKVILITSAMQGEGKSITAANLAISLAETSGRVLVMDCDMRRPKVGRLLQMKADAGLSNMLIDSTLAEKNILRYRDSVDVILAGSIPPNPSELLSSGRMQALIAKMKEKYDYIILDTPPVNIVTDAVALSPLSDGVLFVVRAEASERGMVTQGVEHLEYANAKMLGFVLTCVPLEKTNYGYSKYRYKKYGRYGYRRYGYGKGYGYGYDKGYGYGYGYGYGKRPTEGEREEWHAAALGGNAAPEESAAPQTHDGEES